jgi:hypothetical protein
MASKIIRKTAQLFGVSAGATGVEEFASKQTGGTLVYSIDPSDLQTAAWSIGWLASIYQGAFAPYYQDRNAVDLVAFYQIAYLLQQGIPEWDASTTYFQNSVVQNVGRIYISLIDSNLNNVPPSGASNAYWQLTNFPFPAVEPTPTRTVLISGSGTYNPPSGCIRIFVRMVGGGGGGGGTGDFSSGGNGGSGGTTSFGLFNVTGGNGGIGVVAGQPAAGGSGGSATGGSINISGTYGSSSTGATDQDTPGGSSKFGGYQSYGSGGPGGGTLSGVPAGGGGGSAGYLEGTILNPSPITYSVGSGGAGGSMGSGGYYAGGSGKAGIIIVDEFYF